MIMFTIQSSLGKDYIILQHKILYSMSSFYE